MSMELIDKQKIFEKLKHTLPELGKDNSKERYRYMQWLADNNAIKELPTVKAIPLERLEQIREEIEKRMETIIGRYDNSIPEHDRPLCRCARNEARQECIEIIDKAIKEQN